MPSALERIDIAPPRDAGAIRSFGLALLIHAALIAALTWGVSWKRSDTAATFAAELWTNAPQEAAPVAIPPPPVPIPTPAPAPAPTPLPQPPPPKAVPPPEPIVKPAVVRTPPEPTPKVDIALEQEKKRKLLNDQQLAKAKIDNEKTKALEAQADKKLQQLKAEQVKTDQAKADQAKADRVKADQVKADRVKAEQVKANQLQADQVKAERLKAERLAITEQFEADAQKAKQAQQAADKQRDENLDRIRKMMDKPSGNPPGDSTSRATAGGKGSSKTYSAIANAAIKPNVVFTENFDGNPLAKVEVRLQSDGTIISSRIVQPSGNKNWDNAVLNAVVRTRVMPKDVDGTLPDTILILEFKPRF